MSHKGILMALALASLSVLFSCSSGSSNALSLAVGQKSITLLNTSQTSEQALVEAGQTSSTPTPDKTAVSFSIPSMTVGWNNTNQPVALQYINIELISPIFSGGKFVYQIASQELMYDWLGAYYCPTGPASGATAACDSSQLLWFSNSTTSGTPSSTTGLANKVTVNGTTTPSPYLNSNGYFAVGGVPLPDATQSYSGTAIIYMYATYTDGGGNQNPVTALQALSWTYQGTQ